MLHIFQKGKDPMDGLEIPPGYLASLLCLLQRYKYLFIMIQYVHVHVLCLQALQSHRALLVLPGLVLSFIDKMYTCYKYYCNYGLLNGVPSVTLF